MVSLRLEEARRGREGNLVYTGTKHFHGNKMKSAFIKLFERRKQGNEKYKIKAIWREKSPTRYFTISSERIVKQ